MLGEHIPPHYSYWLLRFSDEGKPIFGRHSAMITNETEFVIVDEWSASSIESKLVKCILQGGWLVSAVKHGLPRTVMNNSPY